MVRGQGSEVRGQRSEVRGQRSGTLLLEGGGDWRGPGGECVLQDTDADLIVFHAYSATTGKAALQISTLEWKKGWPQAGVLAGAATGENMR